MRNQTEIIMQYIRDKKEYVRPQGTVILLTHNVHILQGSYEQKMDIYIDEIDEEEERNDVIFG